MSRLGPRVAEVEIYARQLILVKQLLHTVYEGQHEFQIGKPAAAVFTALLRLCTGLFQRSQNHGFLSFYGDIICIGIGQRFFQYELSLSAAYFKEKLPVAAGSEIVLAAVSGFLYHICAALAQPLFQVLSLSLSHIRYTLQQYSFQNYQRYKYDKYY